MSIRLRILAREAFISDGDNSHRNHLILLTESSNGNLTFDPSCHDRLHAAGIRQISGKRFVAETFHGESESVVYISDTLYIIKEAMERSE